MRLGLNIVVLALAVLVCGPGYAQDNAAADDTAVDVSTNYKTIDVVESLTKSKSKSRLSSALRNGFAAGDQALFVNMCDNYFLAEWTQPENYHRLPSLHQQFRSKLQSCKDSPTRSFFNKHLLAKLQEMAADNYHPAVRYNSMKLLGELDQTPSTGIRAPATPLPEALPVLLRAAADENQIDTVKLAALLGVARHASVLTDAAARRDVGKAMSRLATTKRSPGTSSEGQSWMRCIAIDTLGILTAAGDQGSTAKTLLGIVDDEEDPFRVRVAAAHAVGNLTFGNSAGLNPDAMVRQLGRLAMSACNTEIKECKEKGRTISPRTLKSRLIAARIGLMGTDVLRVKTAEGGAMSLVEKSEDRKNATAIREQIDSWIGLLDDKRLMKKVEPPQDPRARGMGRFGMGGLGMGRGGRGVGDAEKDKEAQRKKASDEIIKKIKADLKGFAVLVQ